MNLTLPELRYFFFILILIFPGVAHAQKSAFTAEDALNIRSFTIMDVTDDGKYVAGIIGTSRDRMEERAEKEETGETEETARKEPHQPPATPGTTGTNAPGSRGAEETAERAETRGCPEREAQEETGETSRSL